LVVAQAAAHDRLAVVDQGAIPAAAVLLAEQREAAVGANARCAAGLGQEQQRQQPGHLRLVGHQRCEDPRQADRLAAEISLCLGGLPGGVDEIDDSEHGAQAVGELVLFGDAVGDSGGLDLALGPCETGRHRRFGDEKGACDLLGRQASEESERERDLGLGGECRVAAGEDETETVVLHGARLLGKTGVAFGCEHGHLA
jgi:hypothetical protein